MRSVSSRRDFDPDWTRRGRQSCDPVSRKCRPSLRSFKTGPRGRPRSSGSRRAGGAREGGSPRSAASPRRRAASSRAAASAGIAHDEARRAGRARTRREGDEKLRGGFGTPARGRTDPRARPGAAERADGLGPPAPAQREHLSRSRRRAPTRAARAKPRVSRSRSATQPESAAPNPTGSRAPAPAAVPGGAPPNERTSVRSERPARRRNATPSGPEGASASRARARRAAP